MTLQVAVLDDYQRIASACADWSRLEGRASVTFFDDHLPFGPDLVGRLRPFDVVCVMRERTPFPRELIEQLPNLRLLLTSGDHNAAIDLRAAREAGIVVSGTDSHGRTASELTIALMLALARNLVDEVNSVRAGGWQVGIGRSLHGATLGLVGFGRVAHQVAAIANAFGMTVIAHTLMPDPADAAVHDVELVSTLDDLLRRSDFASIHVRLTERTRGLIDAERLAAMPETAYLINTSRGPVVDDAALIDALERGTIAGAAIDVYDEEPLPADHPLRRQPKLLTTPHIGYVIREAYEIYYRQMVQAVEDFLDGRELRQVSGD